MTGDPEKLKIRRTVWRSKGIIRRLYGKWFSMIAESLAPGKTLEVGGVVHNDGPTLRLDAMPYGGIKQSGMGREGARWAIEEMTEPRLLLLSTQE